MSKEKKPDFDYTSGLGQKRMFYDAHDNLFGRESGNTWDTITREQPYGGGDYGCDPVGEDSSGVFRWRMIPSGDIVDRSEMRKRLSRERS